MLLSEWIMTIFTGLIGIGGMWAAIFDVPAVFQSNKIGFFDRRLGHSATRLVVGIAGFLIVLLAISFVLIPPR